MNKIQKFIHTLDIDKENLLSAEERTFARNYKETLEVCIISH